MGKAVKPGGALVASRVMPGLVPGIHVVRGRVDCRTPTRLYRTGAVYSWTRLERRDVDGRDKPGHDGTGAS
jgi:hypothetical protein